MVRFFKVLDVEAASQEGWRPPPKPLSSIESNLALQVYQDTPFINIIEISYLQTDKSPRYSPTQLKYPSLETMSSQTYPLACLRPQPVSLAGLDI